MPGFLTTSLLANHVPLETELIGANEHESHYVFDICYHNTSDIVPTAITGDMHSVNKANFAILHWFGLKLTPRFTNLAINAHPLEKVKRAVSAAGKCGNVYFLHPRGCPQRRLKQGLISMHQALPKSKCENAAEATSFCTMSLSYC